MDNRILDSEDEKVKKEKKSMSPSEIAAMRKDAYFNSQKLLDDGHSKAEIMQLMNEKYGHKHDKFLARVIGFSITSMDKTKNRSWQMALVFLQSISVLATIAILYLHFRKSEFEYKELVVILSAFSVLIEAHLVYVLIGYRLEYLAVIATWNGFKLFGYYDQIINNDYGQWMYGYAAVLAITILVSLRLKKKLFPDYGFYGPKKNSLGKYML